MALLPGPLLTRPVSIHMSHVVVTSLTSPDGMIKVIDSATRESCGGKQMRL